MQSDAFTGPQSTHFIESPPFAVATQSSLIVAGVGHLSEQNVASCEQASFELVLGSDPLLDVELEDELLPEDPLDDELLLLEEPLSAVAQSAEVSVAPLSPHDHVDPPIHAL